MGKALKATCGRDQLVNLEISKYYLFGGQGRFGKRPHFLVDFSPFTVSEEKASGPSDSVRDPPPTHKSGLQQMFQNGKTGTTTTMILK